MTSGGLEADDDLSQRSPADAISSFIQQILALGAAGFVMMQLFPMLPLSTRMMLTALCIISLRLWGGLMLLAAGLLDLYLRDIPRRGALETGDALTWTLLLTAVAMFGFRQRRSLQQLSNRSIRAVFRDMGGGQSAGGVGASEAVEGPQYEGVDGLVEKLLASCVSGLCGLLVLLVLTVCSAVGLELLPRGGRLAMEIRGYAAADPELSGVVLLATVVVGLLLIAGEAAWRQQTPGQARMYLRSQRLGLFFDEFRRLARQRLRERLRRVRERHPPGD